MQPRNSLSRSRIALTFVSWVIWSMCVLTGSGEQPVSKKKDTIQSDLPLVELFVAQHLAEVLPKVKTQKNFPSGGLREDVMAISKWCLSKEPKFAKSDFVPISILFVLSGDFSSNSNPKLNDTQTVKDEQQRGDCIVAWYYNVTKNRRLTMDVICTCLPVGIEHTIVVMRSFDLKDSVSWVEISAKP